MVLVGLIDIPVIEILLFLSVIIFLLLIESIIILVLLIKQLQKAKGEHQHQAPPAHPAQHHHKKRVKREAAPDRNLPDSGNMPLKEGYVPGKPAASALPPQSPPFRSTIISNLPSSPPPSDSPMEKNARSPFFSKKSNIRFSRDWLRR